MLSQEVQNGKRLAKNTLLLYFRMFITMAVGLYTSRVILKNLGVEDFGIYNVVGGVVALFTTITGSLTAAIQRFLTFELGKNDVERLRKVFASSVFVQFVLAVIIACIAEVAGTYFLNVKINIPIDRLEAARWVLHFSIITFSINLVSVPYNATIIAHERMSVFAYVSIFEALAKLGIAFSISISPIDNLIFYAILMCIVAVIVRIIYGIYCKKSFNECSLFSMRWDKNILKEIFGFAGWNFIGATSAILRDQGGNILLNLFFGPVVNAARGIANQVNNAVSQFVTGFTTALNPQITKSFASNDHKYMMDLIYTGARLSFYMLMIVTLPVFFHSDFLLGIWLGNFPVQTTIFVQLILIFTLSESISGPLITAMLATGKIRDYQLLVGGLQMLNLPVSYILLRNAFPAEYVLIVAIVISQCCFFARIFMLKKMIGLSIRVFLAKVYFNVLFVMAIASTVPLIMATTLQENMANFIMSAVVSVLWSTGCVYLLGCSSKERKFVIGKIKEKLNYA